MQSRRVYGPKPAGRGMQRRSQGLVGAGVAAAAAAGKAVYDSFTKKKAPQKKMSRYPKRRRGATRRATNTLAGRVSSLEKKMAAEYSKLIYKNDDAETLRTAASEALYGFQSAVSVATIETAITNCRFFDPSAPNTLITGNLGAATYSQNIRVAVASRILFTNNYQVPCILTCGLVVPREDTNITPNQARTNGYTDVGITDSASVLLSYNDSPQFRQVYRPIKKLKSIVLKPGQSYTMYHGQKSFMYDPAYSDSMTSSYSVKHKSALFIYRVQGVLAHDTAVTTQQGIAPAGIDVYINSIYTIFYNSGGASVTTVVVSEASDQTFTNSAVVSQIVVDNQSYSVA